jgi:hypothetical protein
MAVPVLLENGIFCSSAFDRLWLDDFGGLGLSSKIFL